MPIGLDVVRQGLERRRQLGLGPPEFTGVKMKAPQFGARCHVAGGSLKNIHERLAGLVVPAHVEQRVGYGSPTL